MMNTDFANSSDAVFPLSISNIGFIVDAEI